MDWTKNLSGTGPQSRQETKPFVIAEISSNHNQDLERAKELIQAAAEAGVDAVKFQLFSIEELFHSSALAEFPGHRERSKWELPRDYIPELRELSTSLGIQFGCTPFDLDSAKFLQPFVDFLKISSYELLWHDLIRMCASLSIPTIMSTGMATEDEVRDSVQAFFDAGGRELSLLHCVSAYPTPAEEANLRAIPYLRQQLGIPVGWSDHSHSLGTVLRACFKWDAEIVELHFDLDGRGYEASSGHCWSPAEVRRLMAAISEGILSDGRGGKAPTPAEIGDRDWRADPSDGLRPILETRRQFRS